MSRWRRLEGLPRQTTPVRSTKSILGVTPANALAPSWSPSAGSDPFRGMPVTGFMTGRVVADADAQIDFLELTAPSTNATSVR